MKTRNLKLLSMFILLALALQGTVIVKAYQAQESDLHPEDTFTVSVNSPTEVTVVLESPSSLTPSYNSVICDSGWYRYTNNRGVYAYLTLNTNQSSQSTNSARWTPNLPQSGTWKVEAYISDHDFFTWPCTNQYIGADSSAARYEINYAGGTTTVSVNQSPVTNAWVTIGVYQFASGSSGYVKLSDLTGDANFSKFVSFSAMRFTLQNDPPPPSGTDLWGPTNLTPAYGSEVCTSGWYRYTNTLGDYAYLTLNTNQASQSTNSARWTPTLPQAGTWKVEAYISNHEFFAWPCTGTNINADTSSARYEIHYNGGTDYATINQASLTDEWITLGTYQFASGSSGYVELTDLTNDSNFSRFVSFGAMRFTLQTTPPPLGTSLEGPNGLTPTYNSVVCDSGWYRYTNDRGQYAYLTVNTRQSSYSTNSARWTPSLPQAGHWRVEVYIPDHPFFVWPCTGQYIGADTSDARYTVYYSGGNRLVAADQAPVTNSWLDLGTYYFQAGTNGYVTLTDLNGEPDFSKFISFSAMRFVYVDSDPPTPDVTAPGGNITSPSDGMTIGPGTLHLAAEAWDNSGGSGVWRVEFWVKYDGSWYVAGDYDYQEPYAVNWQIPTSLSSQYVEIGIHVVDNAGNMATDPGGKRLVHYDASMTYNIVEEARTEIGMPYRVDRDVYCGNWGPWKSRFGVCTDLVIDAYLAGTGGSGLSNVTCKSSRDDGAAMLSNEGGINLQYLLSLDYLNHPERYPKGNTARSATNLRAYFQHNQIYLDKTEPWQPGDIVFYNLTGSSDIIEHVAIVTKVNTNGMPAKKIEATGTGQNGCPNGLACERTWTTADYNATVGHGRLASLPAHGLMNEQNPSLLPTQVSYPYLEITVSHPATATLQLILRDSQGNYISDQTNYDLIASNNEEFIPYIPYTVYERSTTTELVRYYHPLAGQYFLEITGNSATDYNLQIETYLGTTVLGNITHQAHLAPFATQGLTLNLFYQDTVNLYAQTTSLTPRANVEVPKSVSASVTSSQTILLSWRITETTNLLDSGIITASVSVLTDYLGYALSFSQLDSNTPELHAGESAEQWLRLSVPTDAVPGIYLGALQLRAADSRIFTIPIELAVTANIQTIYLPMVLKYVVNNQ